MTVPGQHHGCVASGQSGDVNPQSPWCELAASVGVPLLLRAVGIANGDVEVEDDPALSWRHQQFVNEGVAKPVREGGEKVCEGGQLASTSTDG